jgi:glycine cleavage system H lipoate-binding protein
LGVTDFFQNQIGEVSQITLKKKDNSVPKGKTIGLVQAKNYSAILKSPIGFKIIETNDKLIKKPKIINSDPYSIGWIYKIQLNKEEDLNGDKLVSTEDPRLEKYIEYEKKNNALLSQKRVRILKRIKNRKKTRIHKRAKNQKRINDKQQIIRNKSKLPFK